MSLTGIYGGTFDPIHIGHINLAIEMIEAHNLSEVWFCPVRISPHKLEQPPTSPDHRLEMVKVALESIPHCHAIDVEVTRDGPSYTLDTLHSLQEQYPDKNFCLILGDDAAPNFIKWHKPEEIIKKVPIFIGRRLPQQIALEGLIKNKTIYEALKQGFTLTRVIDVSSTEIRNRLAEGKFCGHLLPAKVMDYIYTNKLYYFPEERKGEGEFEFYP